MAASSSAIGSTVVAWASTRPPSCTKAAPAIICVNPTNPEAVPAACGRTLMAPAIAFGSITPLPNPMTSWGTKMMAGPHEWAKAASITAPAVPIASMTRPHQIIASMPCRSDSCEVR